MFFTHTNGFDDQRLSKLVNGIAAQLGTVLQQKKVQAEMKALFAAMIDMVTVRDVSGRCLNIIPTKAANVYKLPEAMIGRKLHQDLPRPQADLILQGILQAISTQETVSIEYSLPIDSKEIWLAETISPLSTETAILVARDISDRKQAEAALYLEKQKSEQLLLNILPQPIVEQLRNNPDVIAEQFNDVTILFADLVGFTPLAARLKPIELVKLLNQIFSRFDQLVDQLGLEKIKTIGDAYMVADGLPVIDLLKNDLSPGDQATLLAVDGDSIQDIDSQIQRLPRDASHLFISVGGNDTLQYASLLVQSNQSAPKMLDAIATMKAEFDRNYQQMLSAVLSLDKPTVLCTIYDQCPLLDPAMRLLEFTALSMFNDCITRQAIQAGLPLIDLRVICNEVTDYSTVSPI